MMGINLVHKLSTMPKKTQKFVENEANIRGEYYYRVCVFSILFSYGIDSLDKW